MLIKLTPYLKMGLSTSSILEVNGKFECFTLEDTFRQSGEKIDGETCIPGGLYQIVLRNEGGMNSEYKKRLPLKQIHRGMIWLQHVTNFQWIYMHIGNKVKDTLGCILVGDRPVPYDDKLFSSTTAYIRLYKKILVALDAGELIHIEVRR